ncbi:MAG: hypothetical protein A2219_04420 [Elusimicrobia bacterium RIFOXYA2_FULL_50_26]|nr:MAG: hypothetical protein A2219_04420 [Elusimicrobia bacterium RIFOXYA2_FULL_50_26]
MKLFSIIKKLSGKNEVYIVGGWLRDALLGRPNKDLDIATAASPAALSRKLAAAAGGTVVTLDRQNEIYRVVLNPNFASGSRNSSKNSRPLSPRFSRPNAKVGLKKPGEIAYVDICRLKGKTIGEDLVNRDFTITSIAMPLPLSAKTDFSKVIDPVGARNDLKRRLVRATSDRVFTDDPLRLLRAYRMAAELSFKIEPATLKLIKKHARLITRAAPERIREELFRILATPQAAAWIEELDSGKLLERILPETARMKKSARKFYFHPRGLWQHAMETLVSLERLLGGIDKLFPGQAALLNAHLDEPLSQGITRRTLLKITALLHDVAKPHCARKVGKRMRFLGHETKGARIASAILRRLRLPGREIKIAGRLIENHMRPISLGQAPALTARAYYRFFRDLGAESPDLVLLSLADCASYRRLKTPVTVEFKKQERILKEIIARYYEQKKEKPLPRLADGHALMKHLKIKPGPVIGKLLSAIAEAQAMGEITTKKEALALAEEKLTLLEK